MMMKKTIHLLALGVLLNAGVYAQSVEDGVKAYYNGNYASAVSILEKNADKSDAAYWLAQSYFQQGKNDLAKAIIEKALAAKPGDPYILASKGRSQLLEKNTAGAVQSFEAAIAAAGKKDDDKARVLNAVGNSITKVYNNIDKIGDINYAVQKLTDAKNIVLGIKEKSRDKQLLADIFTNLADASLKANPGEGSQAFSFYQEALTVDPSFANAEYRKAKIFKSQNNVDLYLQTLEKALALNAGFYPALDDIFEYYTFTAQDFAKAKPYGDKMVALLPPSPNNEYFKGTGAYFSKSYVEAINIGKDIISKAGDQTNPLVYKLVAYSFIANKDTASAIPFVENYFKNQVKENILPNDFSLKAIAYSTTPGKEAEVVKTFLEAAAADTSVAGKVKILEQGAEMFAKNGKGALAGDLYAKILEIKPADKLTINDYFAAGYTGYYKAGNYEKAWQVFDAARTKFPDWNYAYRFAYQTSRIFDSTYSQNKWIPDAEKFVAYLQSPKDTSASSEKRPLIFRAAVDLLTYHYNVKKDNATALTYALIAHDNADDPAAKEQLAGYVKALGGTVPTEGTPTAATKKE